MTFVADESVRHHAEHYAREAVRWAKENFAMPLDGSPESIEKIEFVLDMLHVQRAQSRPTDEQIAAFSKMIGSYVGEVYRGAHGGTWGMVTLHGETFPGMQAEDGALFWPWGKVQNRILNGREDNILAYYKSLTTKSAPE